jgi:hypothetical protein
MSGQNVQHVEPHIMHCEENLVRKESPPTEAQCESWTISHVLAVYCRRHLDCPYEFIYLLLSCIIIICFLSPVVVTFACPLYGNEVALFFFFFELNEVALFVGLSKMHIV